MKIIKLNQEEFEYLKNTLFLSKDLEFSVLVERKNEDVVALHVSEDQADKIRDLCNEKLQIVGFDEDYNLTNEGKILDHLIDKFYFG